MFTVSCYINLLRCPNAMHADTRSVSACEKESCSGPTKRHERDYAKKNKGETAKTAVNKHKASGKLQVGGVFKGRKVPPAPCLPLSKKICALIRKEVIN
jgi:hypothetical protein